MDPGGTYYNTNTQVEALETLLRKLPDPTTPAPPPVDRPKPGRARQLDTDQVQMLIQGVKGHEDFLVGGQLISLWVDTSSPCAWTLHGPVLDGAVGAHVLSLVKTDCG